MAHNGIEKESVVQTWQWQEIIGECNATFETLGPTLMRRPLKYPIIVSSPTAAMVGSEGGRQSVGLLVSKKNSYRAIWVRFIHIP